MRIVERIEQAIKIRKIKGLIMGSRIMIRDESEGGSQVGHISYVV